MSIKDFIKSIFSVRVEGFHKVFCILGIRVKIKCIPKLYDEIKNLRTLLDIIVDISNIPKAKGNLRDLQIADALALSILHQTLVSNNMQYWLAGGNVLGYVRHNGFVPWDDDVDINIMREDYLKLPQILDTLSEYGFNYSYGNGEKNNDFIIRLKYKNSPVQIDIFPFDYYYKSIETQEEINKLQEDISKCYRANVKKYRFNKNLTLNEKLKKISDISNKNILKNQLPTKDIIYRGPEFCDNMKAIYKYNDIFPLQEVIFEGVKVLIPNNPHNYLVQSYGDYMKLPKKIFECNHFDISGKLDCSIKSIIPELEKIKEDII